MPMPALSCCGDGLDLAVGPAVDVGDAGEHRVDRGWALASVNFLRRKIELTVGDQAGTIGERARAGRGLGGGLERIPDHPGIDGAALERRARVGRRQVDRLDLRIFQAGLFQRT